MNFKSTRFWLIAAIFWGVLIYLGTNSPVFAGPHTRAIFGSYDRYVRILGHLTEFIVLSVALYGIAHTLRLNGWQSILFVFSITLLIAFSDEFHQMFVAGRSYKLIDVAKDMTGAALGLLIVKLPAIRNRFFPGHPRYRRVIYYA